MQGSTFRLVGASAITLLAVLLWDFSGLDLALARLSGDSSGFALHEHWLLTTVLHTGAKSLAWLLTCALCVAVAWPPGPLRRLPMRRRLQLAVSALLASAAVTLLKAGSQTSCPWDLAEFGGIASHVSHWSWWATPDGGAGHCFPAGHAASGFAFVGGFFALRADAPRLARGWLAGALIAGLALGISQQLRGAHFMSHTLWTAWLCWATACLAEPLFAGAGRGRATETAL